MEMPTVKLILYYHTKILTSECLKSNFEKNRTYQAMSRPHHRTVYPRMHSQIGKLHVVPLYGRQFEGQASWTELF